METQDKISQKSKAEALRLKKIKEIKVVQHELVKKDNYENT